MHTPNKPDTNGGHKKAYSKPELIRFPLRPQEAVLGTCKIGTTGGAGPLQSHCTVGGISCSVPGS